MVFPVQILGLQRLTSSQHGLAGIFVALALTTGCGQKGPLFIATPPVVPAVAVNPATPPAISPASPFTPTPSPAASAPR